MYVYTGCSTKMSYTQLFNKFYPNLIDLLPMKDPKFISRLVQQGLFFGNLRDEMLAKPTCAEAAAHFLSCAIERFLKGDDGEPFTKLLVVMEKFGNSSLKKLAVEIFKVMECCVSSAGQYSM